MDSYFGLVELQLIFDIIVTRFGTQGFIQGAKACDDNIEYQFACHTSLGLRLCMPLLGMGYNLCWKPWLGLPTGLG